MDVKKAVDYVVSCQNFDGGYGVSPGAESHSGQVYTCVGTLAIAKRLDLVDITRLGQWLSERQVDAGGLNGRPEKLEVGPPASVLEGPRPVDFAVSLLTLTTAG